MQSISLWPLLVLVLAGSTANAAETGLYDMRNASRPVPLPDRIKRVTLVSMSNGNKDYMLTFEASSSFSLSCDQIGLIVGDKTIRFDGAGWNTAPGSSTPTTIGSIATTIQDEEVIQKIIDHFHADVQRRRHPGHRMLVQFLPEKAEFKAGEAVLVKLRITNLGNSDFTFIQGGRQRRATRDNQFAFSAHMSAGAVLQDVGDAHHNGGLGLPVTLAPGKSFERSVDLSDWFAFTEPGTYFVRGSYYMEFVDPDPRKLPWTIWEDFACAEFTIEVER